MIDILLLYDLYMVIIWLMMVNNNLVGGFKYLENMKINGKDDIPCIMEHKKCLKPPTSYAFLEGNTSRICEKAWLMVDLTNLGDINHFISFPIQGQHCLVGGIPTPLKNMSSSVGMLFFPTEWEKMFQTTNQLSIVSLSKPTSCPLYHCQINLLKGFLKVLKV